MASARIVNSIVSTIEGALAPVGLTVVQPLQLDWYNSHPHVARANASIRTAPPAAAHALTILAASTRDLWMPFLQHCKDIQKALASGGEVGAGLGSDPLDSYCQQCVRNALQVCLEKHSDVALGNPRIIWINKKTEHLNAAAPGWISAQRMATAAGLSAVEPISHLAVHPRYGPWFSLRAVIVFDAVAMHAERPRLCEEVTLDSATKEKVRTASAEAIGGGATDIAPWRKWLAVRDALSPGHPWRFSDEQLQYHYTKDMHALQAFVNEL